jgi:hypothetical protein
MGIYIWYDPKENLLNNGKLAILYQYTRKETEETLKITEV